MSRVKRGTTSLKHRRNVLFQAKGFRFGRGNKEIQAKDALRHAWSYMFAHRKDKKNDFRRLWSVKINAALRPLGTTYSKYFGAAVKKKVILDRKVLATIADEHPETFSRIVKEVVG